MTEGGRPVDTRVVVAALVVLCLGALRIAVGTPSAGLVVDAVAALLAGAGTLDAGRRAQPGRSRIAWRCQTAAVGVWLLAPLGWLLGLHPAVAATGRLGFVVLIAAGWWLTSRHADPRSRVRLAVDGCLGAASALVVGWPLGLAEVWSRTDGGLAGFAAVAAPVATVGVVVFAVSLMLTEIPPPRRWMPRLAAAAWVVVAASDVAWGLGERPLWALGWGLWLLGTQAYLGTSRRREVISTRRALVYAPYVVLAPAAIVLAVQEWLGVLSPVQTTTAVVVVVLLLARQHITLAENRLLVQRLAASERRLRHQATHDALTGLPARVLLDERLTAVLDGRRREMVPLAVAFIDLDDFKEINDTYGHAAGDDVLVETARRLTAELAELGETGQAFRVSGDEFAVLLTGPAARDAVGVAGALRAAVRAPMTVNGHPLAVDASVGVAVAGRDTTSPSALLRAADLAMYAVKREGKGGVAAAPPVGRGTR